MQGKWITHLKTLGLVFLVGFGINLLFVGAVALGDYDRLLGQSFHRVVLFIVAYLIVRLWQQRDQSKPLFGEPQWRWRWQWLEGKPERKLVMMLLVALIAVSGLATYLGLHQEQDGWAVASTTPANSGTNPYAKFARAEAVSRALADYCKERRAKPFTFEEASSPPDKLDRICSSIVGSH